MCCNSSVSRGIANCDGHFAVAVWLVAMDFRVDTRVVSVCIVPRHGIHIDSSSDVIVAIPDNATKHASPRVRPECVVGDVHIHGMHHNSNDAIDGMIQCRAKLKHKPWISSQKCFLEQREIPHKYGNTLRSIQ